MEYKGRPLPKRGRKNRPFVPLGQVLFQVSQDLALNQKVNEMAVLALWDQVIGERLRGRALAVRLLHRAGKRILLVKVKDAATAGELSFDIEGICDKLNRYLPQTGILVAGLEIKIGSL